MKKFVLCLFAAVAAFALATGASAAANNNAGSGVVGAAENIVGGAVQGAENIAGGVVNGAENIVGGNHANNYYANNHDKDNNHNNRVTPAPINEHARANNLDRNPATGIGFGLVELAAIGTTMLGTAALAGGKKRR